MDGTQNRCSSLRYRESQHRLCGGKHAEPKHHNTRYNRSSSIARTGARVLRRVHHQQNPLQVACHSHRPGPWTPQATTPPVLARHQDERRYSCAANASGSSACHFALIRSLGSLANDQPERTHRRPQTPQRSTHKVHPTRTLREAIKHAPGRRCSHNGNQHFFSHSIANSCQRLHQGSRRPQPPRS